MVDLTLRFVNILFLLQVLFQLQESRKAIEIHTDDDVIVKVKETFGLYVETGVILQAYI